MKPFTLVCLLLISVSAGSLFVEMTRPDEAFALTDSDIKQHASPIPTLRVDNHNISALMKQPVFTQTRQPLVMHSKPNVVSDPRDVVYELSGQYRLAGVVMTEAQALAVVVDQKTGKTQKLSVDQKIDGWQLKTVEPTLTVFENGQQQRRLALWRQQEKTTNHPPAEVMAPELISVDVSDGVFEDDPYQ